MGAAVIARAAIAATLCLAAPLAAGATCDWTHAGSRPYTGEIPAAVDAYRDIPAATRARLKARMAARQFDEVVKITPTEIIGRAIYASQIRDMHWAGGVCRGVADRSRWPAGSTERGLVYCEDGHCILVPTVCRNVSRITRLAVARTATAARAGTATPPAAPDIQEDGPIDISPSAGVASREAPTPLGSGLRLPMWPLPPDGMTASGRSVPLPLLLPPGTTVPPAPQPDDDSTPWQPPAPDWVLQPMPEIAPPPALILPAPVPAVPEPSAWALLAAGLAAVFMTSRR